ncbi:Uncharacterised protein [Mycobacteroides abscessus subsp. massiliense]|nr:Uncharacterised protein [Mycobacteroides abscessus subsp. massiliense]SKH56253.1 Uncharacterised protein [Mycobacteroides abscessus subsp. massiliense]SKI08411.1 Uncharacterised protein [Mycobacteroides abscessus subsp. massiliense]SKJ39388.1 Uncharacterised protein [Mycobacteroides abscessus subsp. massiliense]SKJ83041.1 Uncharacterised protein [Mycobacteroides abscessus subsp. massiliense]
MLRRRGANTPHWRTLCAIVSIAGALAMASLSACDRRHDSTSMPSPGKSETSQQSNEIASSHDTGPITLIVNDPTCGPIREISDSIRPALESLDKFDPQVSANKWTAERRSKYQEALLQLNIAAEKYLQVARQTPSRVMRELYLQSVAYYQIFARKIESYVPETHNFALAAKYYVETIEYICSAEFATEERKDDHRSVDPGPGAPPLTEPGVPQVLMREPDPVCPAWIDSMERSEREIQAWRRGFDPSLPAGIWSESQRNLMTAVKPVFQREIEKMNASLKTVSNPTLRDLTALSSLYLSAFVSWSDTYVPQDMWLYNTAVSLRNAIATSCQCQFN